MSYISYPKIFSAKYDEHEENTEQEENTETKVNNLAN